MATLHLYRWQITDRVTGQRRPTRWRMTEGDAKAMDPTAEPVPGSLECRHVPDDPMQAAAGSVLRGPAQGPLNAP